MGQAGTKTGRSGCSGVVGGLILCVVLSIIFIWPGYLNSHGSAASGVITDKYEIVRVVGGEGYRHFEIIAKYSIPGQIVPHRAGCNVVEKTYDSLRIGNPVTVRYFAGLLNQPFIPATNVSPCSIAASFSTNVPVVQPFVIVFGTLVVILFFWRVLRLKFFAWLLFPWIALAFFLLGLPRVEPEPQHPVPATATIDSVATIRTLGDMHSRRSFPLQHPYQIVLFKFVPPGLDAAVTAIDKVDADSVPNLKKGQSVNIVYDSEHPRIARLQQGTRLFPGQALKTVILYSGGCILVLFLLVMIGRAFNRAARGMGRRVTEEATRRIGSGPKV